MKIEVVGANSIIIYFGDEISLDVSKKVTSAYKFLKSLNIDGIISLIPSYTTLLITYDLLYFNHKTLKARVLRELSNINSHENEIGCKMVTVPVYYDEEVGYDLEVVASRANLSIKDVIRLHSSIVYNVYAIGFAPGYAYMGLIDQKIQTPRLANPRKKVPKGSVSIADRQTAIYPSENPGGWNIIGRTPIEMFDMGYEGLCLVNVGDSVQFKPIEKNEFIDLGGVI